MPSYKCKIRSKALEAICAKDGPWILHIFCLTVNPPLGAVLLAGSPVLCVLQGAFMYVNNVCPAENQLAASSCMEWRPSCKQTRVEGLFHVKCAEGHREETEAGVWLSLISSTQWTLVTVLLTSCGAVLWTPGTAGSPASVSVPVLVLESLPPRTFLSLYRMRHGPQQCTTLRGL